MGYTRYALILDHADGHLGGAAMRLLEIGVDVLYANDVDEASLMARQEAETLGAVLVPAASSLGFVDRVIQQICTHLDAGPQGLVLLGRDPGERTRSELRSRGVRWGLWDVENERGLRFVMTAAMSTGHEADPRKDIRVPTDLEAIACMGRHRKEARVHDISVGGVYLAAEHPFLAGSSLSIDITLPSGPLWAKGDVVSAKTADMQVRPDIPEGMGVAFTQINDDARETLRAYIADQVALYEI